MHWSWYRTSVGRLDSPAGRKDTAIAFPYFRFRRLLAGFFATFYDNKFPYHYGNPDDKHRAAQWNEDEVFSPEAGSTSRAHGLDVEIPGGGCSGEQERRQRDFKLSYVRLSQ